MNGYKNSSKDHDRVLLGKHYEAGYFTNRWRRRGFNCKLWRQRLCRVIYFVLFYVVLLGISICLIQAVMYFDIDREKPALTGLNSALGFNPGLSIIPSSDIHGNLIRLTSRRFEISEGFTSELLVFLAPYQRAGDRVEVMQCARNDGTYKFESTRPCAFDLDSAWPCNVDSLFGYDGESPCILLKMNKIYGWLPDPVEGADGVVVKCEGVTLDDQINLGYVGYYDLSNHHFKLGFAARSEGKTDNGTFHSDFFPYVNQHWYLQPIVWVVFNEMRRDGLIRVQCHLIAKNIHVDFTTAEGSVQFEILAE